MIELVRENCQTNANNLYWTDQICFVFILLKVIADFTQFNDCFAKLERFHCIEEVKHRLNLGFDRWLCRFKTWTNIHILNGDRDSNFTTLT